MIVLEYIFWFLVFLVFYVYVGYPLVLMVLTSKDSSLTKQEFILSIILFIPAYNEEKVIKNKIENCLALDYPKENWK